jgi:hypothetical protein
MKSFKEFHGQRLPIILTVRYVNDGIIKDLYNNYKNLTVINEESNYEDDANILGISIEEFMKSKKVFEQRDTVNRSYGNYNLLFKQFISVNNRYRNSIKKAMSKCNKGDLLIHFDADTRIKSNLNKMFSYINKYDICIKFRLKSILERRVLGSLISFKINDDSYRFLNVWKKHIDAVDLHDRPKRYGQISFYYAYNELKQKTTFGDLSRFDNLIEKTYRGKQ